jgi:iron complex outermembrane receptor protein
VDKKSPPVIGEVVVTGHFLATGAMSATKQNVSTLDTPFSVSAYTGDFMKTIHTTQVADLYRYMTGLQKAGATGYDLTLRGFSTTDSDRNTILTDGLPGLAARAHSF